jgi:hypothetical protein
MTRHHPDIDGDRGHVAQHRDQARHHGRGKQLGDVLFGQDGIDHQRHRRRDQDAQGATRCQRAGGQAPRIPVALHFRQRDRGDRGCRGHRRPADGAERGTGQHRRHRQAPLETAHECCRKTEQGLRDAALCREMPHQDEQRDHRQVVTGEACEGLGVEETCQRRPPRLRDVTRGSGEKHRDGDRRANRHQHQHDGEDHQCQQQRGHAGSASFTGPNACHRPMSPVSSRGGTMHAYTTHSGKPSIMVPEWVS